MSVPNPTATAATRSLAVSARHLADRLVTDPRARRWLADRRDQMSEVRARAGRIVRHHGVTVPLDRILHGGPSGVPDEAHLAHGRDRRWASLAVPDGPHVDLYRRFADGEDLPNAPDAFAQVPYVQLATACIAATGSFCGCTTVDALVDHIAALRRAFDDGYETAETPRALVQPVKDSDCHAIVDGNHRLARAWVRGEREVVVDVAFESMETPVQKLLERTSWLSGQREIYQPLPMPEIRREWPLIRACSDRFEMMQTHLAKIGITGGSYLDIASCYGWFVAQMDGAGFDAEGIERDPHGIELGEIAYGLPAEQIVVGSAEQLLKFANRKWNVVSCLSLLHHYAIVGGDGAAAAMLALLDEATVDVLYFDTGQAHEEWFSEKLAGWDDAGVIDFVRGHSTFTNVDVLGVDSDDTGVYANNYGRSLFACTRS